MQKSSIPGFEYYCPSDYHGLDKILPKALVLAKFLFENQYMVDYNDEVICRIGKEYPLLYKDIIDLGLYIGHIYYSKPITPIDFIIGPEQTVRGDLVITADYDESELSSDYSGDESMIEGDFLPDM